MTYVPKSRLVLQDIMYVRVLIEDEARYIEWRLYWILWTVLLRSIGYVLDKVDSANNMDVKSASKMLFKQWKSDDKHKIFREFIDRERHSIIKEYEFSMSEGPIPIVAHLQNNDGFDVIRQALIEENIYRPMIDGAYEGDDGRELLDEAIKWWHEQLDYIDRFVSHQ